MSEQQPCRVALLGLMLESNSFAPVTTEEDYVKRVYLAGDEILRDLASSDSMLPTELRGFCKEMDRRGEWTPMPILVGLVEAGGPLDHGFFELSLGEMKRRLQAAMPLCLSRASMFGSRPRKAINRSMASAEPPRSSTLHRKE